MSDDFTQLNPGSGGDYMDESGIVFPTAPTNRKRPRVVISGSTPDEIAGVTNAPPDGTEYGLIVRHVVPNYPGTRVHVQNEITLVAADTETTIVTYTVPMQVAFNFIGFVGSGDTDAVYRLYINNVRVLTARSSVSNPTSMISFAYSPFSAGTASIVELRVTHSNEYTCAFEGTLLGYIF